MEIITINKVFKQNKYHKDIAEIIPRAEHGIVEKNISKNAMHVLRHLHNVGFDAYLVGGCVRDLLLNRHPKDYDIVTNAHPNQIKKLFRNCRLIGRRFRLAHIYFGREILEVATFRAGHEGALQHEARTKDGMVVRDNVYGTIDQDAGRRDFTINALFYNVADHTVLDFFEGFRDLQRGKLDIIGEPKLRYQEDPVRMLRAVRIAGKLGFTLTPRTRKPMRELSHLLRKVPPARLFDETVKTFHSGAAQKIYPLLIKNNLLPQLFPFAEAASIVKHLLRNTDARIRQHKFVAPGFLFAGLLWDSLMQFWQAEEDGEIPRSVAFDNAVRKVLREQSKYIAIPRRVATIMREIWRLQRHLEPIRSRLVNKVFEHPRFRAGYDLLLLRAKVDKELKAAAGWWTQFQEVSQAKREEMIFALDFQKEFY